MAVVILLKAFCPSSCELWSNDFASLITETVAASLSTIKSASTFLMRKRNEKKHIRMNYANLYPCVDQSLCFYFSCSVCVKYLQTMTKRGGERDFTFYLDRFSSFPPSLFNIYQVDYLYA